MTLSKCLEEAETHLTIPFEPEVALHWVKEAKAILASVKGEEWVRVEDGLPESKGKYLVYCESIKGPIQRIAAFHPGDKFNKSEFITAYPSVTVTHWRILPTPPKTK